MIIETIITKPQAEIAVMASLSKNAAGDYYNMVSRKSDLGVYIRNKKTGALYSEAIDWTEINCIRRGIKTNEYEETDIPIPVYEDEESGETV